MTGKRAVNAMLRCCILRNRLDIGHFLLDFILRCFASPRDSMCSVAIQKPIPMILGFPKSKTIINPASSESEKFCKNNKYSFLKNTAKKFPNIYLVSPNSLTA